MDATTVPDELASALLDGREVEAISLHPHAYRTSHMLANLDVAYTDGSSESLVLKDLGPESLTRDSRLARPAFAYEPTREIEVYQGILAGAALGTAAFRCAVVDRSRGRFWLVIERVDATELWQLGSLDAWRRAAGWLAGMHSKLRDAGSHRLVQWTPEYAGRWISRAGRASDDPAVRAAARCSDQLAERLLGLPCGFIHGELYASNVLVDERSGRVCPVDWEHAGTGPMLLDLAALTSGAWTREARREIAAAYCVRAGGSPDLDTVMVDLDLCRLFIALQWIGWSRRWTPPAEHAHDWLADVQELVEEVGLT